MNDPRNPYSPPSTRVADRDQPVVSGEGGQFIPYGRTVSAGRGAAWIGDAWRILKAQPGMWAAMLILMFVAYAVVARIPLLNMFAQLLTPFVYAAIAVAADEQRRTGTFELKAMVSGFERKAVPLLAVGATVFLAGLVFLLVLALFIGSEIVMAMMGRGNPDPSSILSLKFLLAFLVGFALMFPVFCATYMAPQLIMLHDQPAMTAMKMSLAGTLKNILPGLVFGLCGFGLMILSMIPLFLGFLITLPIFMITTYTVYRDIFVGEDA